MAIKVLPGDPRLLDVQEDAQLYLAHAIAFVVAMFVFYFVARALVRRR